MSIDQSSPMGISSFSAEAMLLLTNALQQLAETEDDRPLCSSVFIDLFQARTRAILDLLCSTNDDSNTVLLASISKTLSYLGIPTNLLGYEYLRYAIFIAVKNKDCSYRVTKTLYPMVAKKYHSSVACVERSMRHAIEVCCNRTDSDTIFDYFGRSMNPNSGKPTNSEFIFKVADELRLDHGNESVLQIKSSAV